MIISQDVKYKPWHCRLYFKISFAAIIGSISNLFENSKHAEYHDVVKRLYELGHSTDQLANTMLALMVVSTTELTLGMFCLWTRLKDSVN